MKPIIKLAILAGAIAMMTAVLNADQISTSGNQIGHIQRAHLILGKEVKNARGEDIGKIDDLVVDLESGRLLYAIVDPKGGLPGAGKVAMPPGEFVMGGDGNLIVDSDKATINKAPRFAKERAADPGNASFAHEVYQHFGQHGWWEGTGSSPSKNFGNAHLVSQLTGSTVKGAANEDMGKVRNVVLDMPAGRVVYVVLAPTGDLGANNSVYLLPPNAFTLGNDGNTLVMGVD
jgi:sporulation protein YlmC with PRC-barrel domain